MRVTKQPYPLAQVYGLLEPGPVVLVSTGDARHADIMAMSWHTMLEFEPPLVGCVISRRNASHALLTASGQCVINIPTVDLAEQVVACGNSSGRTVDKFATLPLTPAPASCIAPPLIAECYANLECQVVDTTLVEKYDFFVLEVLAAWIDPARPAPQTLHHRGYGNFMVAGEVIPLPSKMR